MNLRGNEMTKAQLRKELKLNIRTGLTITQAADALIYEFEMYAAEIREIEMDLLVKNIERDLINSLCF